jgi:hypothetical protein
VSLPFDLSLKEKVMNVLQSILNAAQFLFDGFLEIFSDTDNYPAIGFQPYDGEAYYQ